MLINKRGVHSYMPVEIWDMQELQNIQVSRSDLQTPNSDATLNKLSNLFGVRQRVALKKFSKEFLI